MQECWNPLQRRMKSALLLLVVTGVLLYYNWVNEAVESVHVMPRTERVDISELVMKERLSEADLQKLSQQTGLNRKVIEKMLQEKQQGEVLAVQEAYFSPISYEIVETTPITLTEWLVDEEGKAAAGMPLVDIQNGDILVTKNSRFLGWRNGHVGLVVDAENGLVLEALMLGTESQLCKLDKWEECPSFMVLRLKGDSVELTECVAAYAREHLLEVPYHLLAGIFEWEESKVSLPGFGQALREGTDGIGEVAMPGDGAEKPEDISVLSGTQCAHLVWYAYKQFDIDLDSDGGMVVTPYDIQNSPYLEIVQSYGY